MSLWVTGRSPSVTHSASSLEGPWYSRPDGASPLWTHRGRKGSAMWPFLGLPPQLPLNVAPGEEHDHTGFLCWPLGRPPPTLPQRLLWDPGGGGAGTPSSTSTPLPHPSGDGAKGIPSSHFRTDRPLSCFEASPCVHLSTWITDQ